MRVTLIVSIAAMAIPVSGALTPRDIYRHLTEAQSVPKTAFEVQIRTKAQFQGKTQVDSGKAIFAPPDCNRISMAASRMERRGCGDTTWTTQPNGDITRAIRRPDAEIPGLGTSPGLPDFSKLLKPDLRIKASGPGDMVEVETEIETQGQKAILRLSVDTKEWLVRKAVLAGTPLGDIETGIAYTRFAGQPVPSEINTVFGPRGFLRMSFENYRRLDDLPRSMFRGF